MESVTGIGGVFFRARDPASLSLWYQKRLGIALAPSNYDQPSWWQDAEPTVFSPFPETTTYFGKDKQVWMINFRVRNLDLMVAQLQAANIPAEVDPEKYPNENGTGTGSVKQLAITFRFHFRFCSLTLAA